jgi:formamidopyrimidine-DNA glycosylase
MPELPEVEVTLRGIRPFVEKQTIQQFVIRQSRLRWPVPQAELQQLQGQNIVKVKRRGKYLLLFTALGNIIVHLGMSGRLRILEKTILATKHDHIDIIFNKWVLRFTDFRRFGAFLWTKDNPQNHPLLQKLGVEPLTHKFNYLYLQKVLHHKNCTIKSAIMDQRIVVGIGNIYANEALFTAQIHPANSVKNLTELQLARLVEAIKSVLQRAIAQGGTTLKDFLNSEGKPGYFGQKLQVYGRNELPCIRCNIPLQVTRIAQRSTVYCNKCQSYQV